MELKWWEKTVEYSYLASHIERGLGIVIPFSGPWERALGDGLTIEADTFQIIEFKHSYTKACLTTENKKYGDGKSHFSKHFNDLHYWLTEMKYGSEDLPH